MTPPTLVVTPRVVPAGRATTVRLAVSGSRPDRCRILLVPVEGSDSLRHPEAVDLGSPGPDGLLVPRFRFPTEQAYTFRLEDLGGAQPVGLAEARVYALEPDLFALRPWKGDVHMHSNRSDGREEPAEVAAHCRRIGMDFMALTDHGMYEPSLEAMRPFRGVPVDLVMLPGEEVHPPGNPVHILNVGGTRSVNALFASPVYRTEVARMTEELRVGDPGAGPDELYPYASAAWSFARVRECGGLAVFPHPYWVHRSRYDVPLALTDMILERQPYDALELIGGYHVHEAVSNNLQVLRWADELGRGRRVPVVGVSDAHGCLTGSLFGWYYTVVYAPTPAWSDVLPAIRDERSVAVEARPGESPRAFGPYRLAVLTHFLLAEVFPEHDTLCRAEGELMLALLRGDAGSPSALGELEGSVRRLYDTLWAPG